MGSESSVIAFSSNGSFRTLNGQAAVATMLFQLVDITMASRVRLKGVTLSGRLIHFERARLHLQIAVFRVVGVH